MTPSAKKENTVKAEKSRISPKKAAGGSSDKSEVVTSQGNKAELTKHLPVSSNGKATLKGDKEQSSVAPKNDEEATDKSTLAPKGPPKGLQEQQQDSSSGEAESAIKTVPDGNAKVAAQPKPATGTSLASKRQHPGKLDISAAVKDTTGDDSLPSATASISTKDESASKTAKPGTAVSIPAAVSTGSPMKRTAPRTLRVVNTPKSETPPSLPAQSSSSMPTHPATATKIPSRAPSLASIQPPGTPASELISENASIASASVSRASSPVPGGKVGVAPIKKSKSQAKKERQERKRQLDEKLTEEVIASPVEEPVHAPIVGRKKKSKKPTTATATSSGTGTTTPAQSRPPSPSRKASEKSNEAVNNELKTTPVPKEEQPPPKASPERVEEPAPVPEDPKPPSPPPKSPLSVSSILKDHVASGTVSQKSLNDYLFHTPVPGLHTKFDINTTDLATLAKALANVAHNTGQNNIFAEAQYVAKAAGQPVHLGGEDKRNASRHLFTPGGMHLRCLNEEQEQRYLELEARVLSQKGPSKWTGGKKKEPGSRIGIETTASAGLRSRSGSLAGVVTPQDQHKASHKVQEKIIARLQDAARKWRPIGGFSDETMSYVNQYMMPEATAVRPQPQPGQAGSVRYTQGQVPSSVAGTAGVGPDMSGVHGADPSGLGLGLTVTQDLVGKLSLEEIEKRVEASRKETEKHEKMLNGLIKKNRKMGMAGWAH